ncbi:hypothetical protein [Actinomadura sp. 7K507]|uniref:hypothetical protein n=1 Tax=Actinomadura sp. 7K507 TaxID=2530365 RepID=UPI001045F6AA|nr:hypothetical protein [Actinomadura sp. 7K507]TDC79202.1 hypothetical protein E1285_36485 [Actinomadura sp. 7K507]
MTAAIARRSPAWWAGDVRPDQVVQVIEDAFPEVRTVYFGNATGKWWALYGRQGIDERWLEADTPQGLCEAIIESVPRPLRRRPHPDAPCRVSQVSTVRTGGHAVPPRSGPAPVPRAGVSAAGHFTHPLFPPPSRLRRLLDGCRHRLLGEGGDKWRMVRADGSWASR